MKISNYIATIMIGLAATIASGHMEMISPPPFRSKHNRNTNVGNVDYSIKSPLLASGLDYPCKGYQKYLGTSQGKPVATWISGNSYNFTLTGSANHGGGSCQASLSYDKGHSWKVIHSYIGGCPPPGDSSWGFTVPSDAPSGDAVFAWTWFSKTTSGEMYMNCAAVTITNGKKRSASIPFSSRPAAFVANVGNNICTYAGKDVEFPQPGPDVDVHSEGTAPPGQGTCGQAPAGPPTDQFAEKQVAVSSPQISAVQAPIASSSGLDTSKAVNSKSVASVEQSSTAAEFMQQVSSAPAVSELPSTASQPLPSNGNGYGGSCRSSGSVSIIMTPGSPCSIEGGWHCATSGKQAQRCASGSWSAPISMATGTSCQPGTSDSLLIVDQ